MPVFMSMIPGTPMPIPCNDEASPYLAARTRMASHISWMTWSLPNATRVPRVTFSIRSPCWLTAAMRRLVPPRSTPIEKLGIVISVSKVWAEPALALLLALGAVVAAATRDHHALDRSLAHPARFMLTTVNPMLELKESLFPIGVDVVGHRRPAQGNRFPQHFLNFRVKASQVLARKRRRTPARANSGAEQRLVGVNVTHATQKFLVQ